MLHELCILVVFTFRNQPPEGVHVYYDDDSVDSSVCSLSESVEEIFERDGSPQQDGDAAT